jgi:murein DD-endopeptidase MepM/ murein hydrolase activator NlpD
MRRSSNTRLLMHVMLVALLGALFALPTVGLAAGAESEASAPAVPGTETQATTAPETTTVPAQEAEEPPAGVEVQSQTTQAPSLGVQAPSHPRKRAKTGGEEARTPRAGEGVRAKHRAASPFALTPGIPLALQNGIAGVSSFFIESFQIPPFLLPIFQAAGTAYGIPWQMLAAINEVETDYGRDLSVSSAGAEGWMQFLPASWAQYGVDANGDGFKDPYNPADAIFAAARYLRAAGGQHNLKAAIFSYNHSASYVESVVLRAQLLGGTPSELLGAITGLTEARFPVHAAAHFSDGFPTVDDGNGTRTIAGTTIYAQPGAPVIAVQDGEVVAVGDSPTLGRFISLRDAFGNTYVYANLGDVSSVYPVLEPRVNSTVSAQIVSSAGAPEPAPRGPASAGAQKRSPLSVGATVSSLALGAAAGLEGETAPQPAEENPTPAPATTPRQVAPGVSEFSEGANDVFLHTLKAGVQVIAGTVLGRVGPATQIGGSVGISAPHIVFQIRPAGLGAPLIDPKPVLDGWVALEASSIFGAKGVNPFLATSPTVGQVLLESKHQLQSQVLADAGIHLGRCGRQDVQGGRVDKRVLAALEYLSVSGLNPTVTGLACTPPTSAALASNGDAAKTAETVDIVAINRVPVAGNQGPGTLADEAVRRLLMLQGLARPRRIVSLMSYPNAAVAERSPHAANGIRVAFALVAGTVTGAARAARLPTSTLGPQEWTQLIARLGEIPDPTVGHGPSSAAIPDEPSSGKTNGGNG